MQFYRVIQGARHEGSGADVFVLPSATTTSIRNKYFTPDKEKRQCTSLGVCEGFTSAEVPDIETKIYHFAGLTVGDFTGEMFKDLHKKGKIAVDVQCLLRKVEDNKEMEFYD